MRTTVTTTDPIEAKRLVKADDMAIVLFEIYFNLRKRTEYMMENATDAYDAHEKIFEEIFSLFSQHHLIIDDIIE